MAAEEQDLFDWEFEEELSKKSRHKTGRLGMVKSHVAEQGGAVTMATRVLVRSNGRYSCQTPMWWFNIGSTIGGDNMEKYPEGKGLKWNDHSINWTMHLKKAIGSEGRITEEGLNTVFNGNLRRIPAHMLNIAEEKIKGLIEDWGVQYPPSPNKERPALGISKAKIAICECRFADGASYNAHMESIHGIQTTFQDEI